ncbi:hypothetical protein CHRY9293_01328 [Chryseobacterium potabilaquae]|uniref:Uncharacterized protein n=1 Tax=Chryseobacterium potabilaquae TaxID=2675057 RepID=A0A6N4X9H7_9FLAO|nr:hypothetical protein CHRY9293_01328 [Chryseobacterium potabilaquae]
MIIKEIDIVNNISKENFYNNYFKRKNIYFLNVFMSYNPK